MQYGRVYLTKQGRNLLAKGQAGNELRFTRFAYGDGIIKNEAELFEMKKLKHEIATAGFRQNAVKVNGDGSATISVLLTNDTNASWVDMTEFGIFAQDPDVGEVLYAVGSQSDHPEPIPPSKSKMWELQMDIIVQIGNAENVTINIDRSLTYVTYEEFNDLAGKGRTYQTVKGNWDLIQDLTLKLLGYASSTEGGRDTSVIKISHKDIGPTEKVDGIWDKRIGGFVV